MVALPPGFPSNPVAGLSGLLGNSRANQVIAESNGKPLPNVTDSDQLSSLLEIKLSGIPFPVITFTEHSSQDVAVHKYPNLDSARVEQTGRNPSIYELQAALTNNIYPGANETWKAGTLYPNTFEALLTELYDSSKQKTFFHPFLGERTVVPTGWSYDFASKSPRDGVFLNITLIETINSEGIADTIELHSPMSDMQKTAGALDTELTKTVIQPLNPPNLSIGQTFSLLAGAIRNIANYPKQALAALNAPLIQVNASVQGAGSAIANSPSQLEQTGKAIVNQNKGLILHGPISNAHYYDKSNNAPKFVIDQIALNRVYMTAYAFNAGSSNSATQLIENAIAFTQAMISYYQKLNRVETSNAVFLLYQFLNQLFINLNTAFGNNRNYRIKNYTTLGLSTIYSLSRTLNNTTEQLIQLNPRLGSVFKIPEDTSVRYYQY